MHHPIFDQIPPHHGPRVEGLKLDYVGSQFPAFWDGHSETAADAFTIPNPPFDEEYFEWVDLLESVHDAGNQYVMMELGAGYGRWGVRAGLAARKRGIADIRLVFAEGLPKHVAWLKEALEINHIEGRLYAKAVAYTGEPVPFLVAHEKEGPGWFGQGIGWGSSTRNEQGYDQIFVETVTLEEMTTDLVHIDLIDMDLQKAERDVIAHSMATLNAKVKRVHIGTHAHDIESELREAFRVAGWRNVWDFPCLQENETPFGRIAFTDGVQGWINPAL